MGVDGGAGTGDVTHVAALCPPFALVERHAVVASTMVRAREIAADPRAALPAAVIADRQTHGRGRRGAGWWQSPESLAVSIVIEAPAPSVAPPPTWSLACGVALVETLRDLLPGVATVVRWPNDVHVGTAKLAGILVETTGAGRAIFGIGVNTAGTAADAPEPLRPRVATIPDLTGGPLDRETLLAAFLPRLTGVLAAIDEDPAILPARYQPLCGLAGRDVVLHVGDRIVRGICRGIAADGGLLLETAAGPLHCLAGSLTAPADVWPGDAAD
jgi:BirA family biotin operon repressor/biotin-[acetyl-CoA-carboxylase] ligase